MILVVDDNQQVADVFSEAIRLAGYTVDIANTGAGALLMLKTKSYILAFIDLSLPDINGAEMAITARSYGVTTPMIAVSGAAPLIDPARISAAGFERLLPKPIRVSILVELINETASKGAHGQEKEELE